MEHVRGSIRAPEFPPNLEWLNTPRPLTIKELRGKIVLLDFWTFCCINCIHNLPALHELAERFPNELVIIGVHSGKFPAEHATANIRAAILRHNIRHPVVNDANFDIWQHYTVRAWPTLVVVDPLGNDVGMYPGEFRADEFAPTIQALIDEFERRNILDRRPLDLRAEVAAEPERVLAYPARVLPADSDRLFVADTGHHRILELRLDAERTTGTIVRTFGAGDAALRDGAATEAAFQQPHGLSRTGSTLYVADTGNHAVRAIDLESGVVRTVAGTGEKAHGRYPVGTPTEMPLRSPWTVAADGDVLLIAMAGSHQIWMMLNERQLGPFAGNGYEVLEDGPRKTAGFNQPSDLASGPDHLYVVDAEASAIRAIGFDPEVGVTTLIGRGLFDFGDIDGVGDDVRLQHPTGLAYGAGMLYIADTYNNKIKLLDPTTRRVLTLIGSGHTGHSDGRFADATFDEPEGIAVDGDLLYIADTNNHLIRVANLGTRRVHTLRILGMEGLPRRGGRRKQDYLPAVTCRAGAVQVSLDLRLPPNYKRNAEAPLIVRDILSDRTYTFAPTETPTWTIDVRHDGEQGFDLTVYYCETRDDMLCLIHDSVLVLPIRVDPTGPDQVTAVYSIPGHQ